MGVYQGLTWWNPFMNRIFHLRDMCLWTHAYVRATIVAFAYNGFFLYTILVAKGLISLSSAATLLHCYEGRLVDEHWRIQHEAFAPNASCRIRQCSFNTELQYRLWARIIQNGICKSKQYPPQIPLGVAPQKQKEVKANEWWWKECGADHYFYSNCLVKAAFNPSQPHVSTAQSPSFSQTVIVSTSESLQPSPGKAAEIRDKYLNQLRMLKNNMFWQKKNLKSKKLYLEDITEAKVGLCYMNFYCDYLLHARMHVYNIAVCVYTNIT